MCNPYEFSSKVSQPASGHVDDCKRTALRLPATYLLYPDATECYIIFLLLLDIGRKYKDISDGLILTTPLVTHLGHARSSQLAHPSSNTI